MLQVIYNLDIYNILILILALLFALIYEVINGFHDSANAITIVIYTRVLSLNYAIIISAIFNFLGVFMGGLSVAYSIIHLLPIDILLNLNSINRLMIFSMLFSAIMWNLSTWYFGLPISSSHTLIGSIIGISITNSFINSNSIFDMLNIAKLIEILKSLLFSPLIGLLISGVFIILLRRCCRMINKENYINLTPSNNAKNKNIYKIPIWIRLSLIMSSTGISFAHGANDGQKGIGLIMLILISSLPSYFAVNIKSSNYEIQRTFYAIKNLKRFYTKNHKIFNGLQLNKNLSSNLRKNIRYYNISKDIFNFVIDKIDDLKNVHVNIKKINSSSRDMDFNCNYSEILNIINYSYLIFSNLKSYKELNNEQKSNIRYILVCITNIIDELIKFQELTIKDKKLLLNIKSDLLITIEYAPTWIIFMVAISLSLGTLIGWKRIMNTLSKKIGTRDMTYAQGISAQITTATSIFIASCTGMLVSTTHVLSSAIVGSMIFDKSSIKIRTIKNILFAWIFTIPVTIIITSSFYLSLRLLFK